MEFEVERGKGRKKKCKKENRRLDIDLNFFHWLAIVDIDDSNVDELEEVAQGQH